MRKVISILIIILSLVLVSCTKEEQIDYEINVPSSILMGDTSYSGIFLRLNNNETVNVTSDMFLNGTELAVYKEGEQNITLSYKKVTKSSTINVVRRTFENITLEDKEVKYTGESISLTVSGNLPLDASVYYGEGNSFKEIGEYTITCTISHPYYNTLTLSAKLKIVGGTSNE